jgi:L-lysine 2,3-aminomutase
VGREIEREGLAEAYSCVPELVLRMDVEVLHYSIQRCSVHCLYCVFVYLLLTQVANIFGLSRGGIILTSGTADHTAS